MELSTCCVPSKQQTAHMPIKKIEKSAAVLMFPIATFIVLHCAFFKSESHKFQSSASEPTVRYRHQHGRTSTSLKNMPIEAEMLLGANPCLELKCWRFWAVLGFRDVSRLLAEVLGLNAQGLAFWAHSLGLSEWASKQLELLQHTLLPCPYMELPKGGLARTILLKASLYGVNQSNLIPRPCIMHAPTPALTYKPNICG